VFAIPGSIHSTQSRGCHALIKQGAKLVESAQDVLEELQSTAAWLPNSDAAQEPEAFPSELNFEGEDSTLLQAMGFDPVALDGLQARTGLPTPDLLAQLMTLELQGVVTRLAGGLFQRMART
jgi:DNA processing protein